MQGIDSGALISSFGNLAEHLNFLKCILPVLSDRALEPKELTLLQSIYLSNETLVSS